MILTLGFIPITALIPLFYVSDPSSVYSKNDPRKVDPTLLAQRFFSFFQIKD